MLASAFDLDTSGHFENAVRDYPESFPLSVLTEILLNFC